jgi:hypothetical protein
MLSFINSAASYLRNSQRSPRRILSMGGASTWTKRNKASGEFMAVKKSSAKKSAKKFKGVRREKV